MKKPLGIGLALALLGFAAACRDTAAANKALAARFLAAYQTGDSAALEEICSPGFVEHGVGRTFSLGQMIEIQKGNMAVFSGFTIIPQDMITEGDKIAIRYLLKVTHTGDGLGIPATGKEAGSTGIEILRFENGKIAEAWAEEDVLSLLTQLGFELKPKEEKR